MGKLLLFIWVCRGAVSGAVSGAISAVIPSEAATWRNSLASSVVGSHYVARDPSTSGFALRSG